MNLSVGRADSNLAELAKVESLCGNKKAERVMLQQEY